ncbi:MAG: ABC transporter substrate-binding protein [Candidatus Rokubacteria bacterium]|nr:ABC transporter substrate-binding protein [Candidatus Rokubacteria bacterium]
MTPRRALMVAAALLVAVSLQPRAWAGQPADHLFAGIDQALRILDDPELRKPGRSQERRQAIRRIMNHIFDFEEISRRSLGRHWEERTPAERDEFIQVFGDLLERSYMGQIETYNGEKVALLGDTIEGESATVRTKIVTGQGAEVLVEYRMLRRGDRWRAFDVVFEGVSLVANYRSQFDRIIQRTSYQQLVKQVREKQ